MWSSDWGWVGKKIRGEIEVGSGLGTNTIEVRFRKR